MDAGWGKSAVSTLHNFSRDISCPPRQVYLLQHVQRFEGPIQIPMGWPISFAESQNPYQMLTSSDGDYVAARDQPPGWVLARGGHEIRVAFCVEQ